RAFTMVQRLAAIASAALLLVVVATQRQPASAQAAAQPPAATPAAQPTADAKNVSAQRALLDRYCVSCHNTKAKGTGQEAARKLTLDDVDVNRVSDHPEIWETVVRKLRAGMMPPPSSRRPDKATYDGFVTWLETELDRNATPYMPPPGLHRMNRTEYANVVRDLLDLDIDPSQYLPSDDSTHGFDNMAGTLGISSTLVEAYVSAAGKISRLAIGEPVPPTLVVYRTPEDTSQDYHIEGLPFGTRGGIMQKHVFPSDGEYTVTVTPIFGDNMSPTGFGSVPCEKLEVLLDGDRLELLDWQGSRRLGAPEANCGGQRGRRGRVAGAPGGGRGAAPPTGGQQGPEAFFGGRGGTPMRARFKTTAGEHMIAATFLATNFAPLLDLDQHFMRDTVQTGPTPGFTFFPHVGTLRIEGPYNAVPAKDSPSRRKLFVCQPASAADESVCARKILTGLATRAFRHPATPVEVQALMEFYQDGRKAGDFDSGIATALSRVLAAPKFIYRFETEPPNL